MFRQFWIYLAGVVPAAFALVTSSACSANAQPLQTPIFDYLDLTAYSTEVVIQPKGYFAIGTRYIHAPRVEWYEIKGAAYYEVVLVQGDKILGITKSDHSPCFATISWNKTRVGKAKFLIQAFDQGGKRIGISRLFPFHVAPDFNPAVSSKQKRPYKEAAVKAFNALYEWKLPEAAQKPADPAATAIEHPVLLTGYIYTNRCAPMSYPNIHDWMHAEMLVQLNKIADQPLKEKMVRYARSVGDHLLMCRLPVDGFEYGGMVRGAADFNGQAALALNIPDAATKEKFSRLVEPAKVAYSGKALIQIYGLTGDLKYLEAALRMGEVLIAKQLDDGSWYARVDGKTGEMLGEYSTSVTGAVAFMEELNKVKPDSRWTKARDKALKWIMDNPAKTYAWVVNYDDTSAKATRDNPYLGNLSNWDLFEFIRFLGDHPGSIPDAAGFVREQLNWCDGHFVFYGDDPLLPFEPYYPCCAEQGRPQSFSNSGLCWVPMDFHTANWISALIQAYRVTKDKVYLEKSR